MGCWGLTYKRMGNYQTKKVDRCPQLGESPFLKNCADSGIYSSEVPHRLRAYDANMTQIQTNELSKCLKSYSKLTEFFRQLQLSLSSL